jgi:hypothetical protein
MSLPISQQLLLPAGTAANGGPVVAQAGALKTTPVAGHHEYDALLLNYYVPGSGQRGLIQARQGMYQVANRIFSSVTTAQTAFGGSAGGAITLGAGKRYRFEFGLTIGSLSASNGSVSFGFGGTLTVTSLRFRMSGLKAASGGATAGAGAMNHYSGASLPAPFNATGANNTATEATIEGNGMLLVNAGGTLIPQIAYSVATAASLQRESFFEIWEMPLDGVVGAFV